MFKVQRWKGALSALVLVGAMHAGVAHADDLNVSTDSAGNVSVNGVIFAASLGMSADQIVALVQQADGPDTQWVLSVSPEVANKVNEVVSAIQVKRVAAEGGQ